MMTERKVRPHAIRGARTPAVHVLGRRRHTMSSKVPFTKEQIAYLESLPAVAAASAVRITYTDEFKRSCLTSYYRGGSPVDLFRKAGLPPELIGYKRIERCFSRWRESASEIFAGQGSAGERAFGEGTAEIGSASEDRVPGGDTTAAHRDDAGAGAGASGAGAANANSTVAASANDGSEDAPSVKDDVRDQLIRQQVRYIIQLEHEIDELKKRVGRRTDR